MLLKQIIFLVFISLGIASCETKKYSPETYLSEDTKNELLLKILPNFAHLPKGYTYERRFESSLNTFYTEEIKKYKIQHYFISNDSVHYFMVNRPAPSLFEKRLAISGKFKIDQQGKISNYEEIFWTFKMKLPELQEKGQILFNEMVEGGNLAEYMPGKKAEEWIEFPDNRVSYNKEQQKWVTDSEL
jgi:hypothetical protein